MIHLVDITTSNLTLAFAIGKSAFALDEKDTTGLLFWKELIYTGDFVKGEMKFSVNEQLNAHWHKTIQDFKAEGIEIPVPVGHTQEPDAKRGKLIDSKLGTNAAGKQALYGLVEFRDKQTATDFKDSNVSIFVVPKVTSGTGKEFTLPIRHVALTDYPIIPGLAPFQKAEALAASFADTTLPKVVTTMSKLSDLAKKYGIEKHETLTEDELLAAIDAKLATPPVVTAPPALSHVKPNAATLKLISKNREQEIQARITSGMITPAQATKLRATHLTEAALSLAFDDKGDLSSVDAFEQTLAIIDAGPKAVALGHNTATELPKLDAANNPVIKNAEARAARK